MDQKSLANAPPESRRALALANAYLDTQRAAIASLKGGPPKVICYLLGRAIEPSKTIVYCHAAEAGPIDISKMGAPRATASGWQCSGPGFVLGFAPLAELVAKMRATGAETFAAMVEAECALDRLCVVGTNPAGVSGIAVRQPLTSIERGPAS